MVCSADERPFGAATAFAVGVGLLLWGLLGVRPVAALTCAAPPPPEEAAAEADAVFTAEVVGFEPDRVQAWGTKVATVHVGEVWVGEVHERELVRTDGGEWPYPFATGSTHLVYASEQSGEWFTGYCSRSALVDEAEEDLAVLGSGGQPEPGRSAPLRTFERRQVLLPAAAVTTALASGVVWRTRLTR